MLPQVLPWKGASTMKLTDRQILNLKPQVQRYEVWEGNAFGVRVTPQGNKSFVFMYRY
jgi:hypothetical protein